MVRIHVWCTTWNVVHHRRIGCYLYKHCVFANTLLKFWESKLKSFEHCIDEVQFDNLSYPEEVSLAVEKSIDEHAESGWELICVAHEGAYKRVLYFKREVMSYEKV